MSGAGGFPRGARTTPVPDLFFSRELVECSDLVALKVALFVLWRVHRRRPGAPAAVAESDLVADPALDRALGAMGTPAEARPRAVAEALDALVARGMLLAAAGPPETGPARTFFVNDHHGRAARERWQPAGDGATEASAAPGSGAGAMATERPNLYALYEDNIGLVTPLVADLLRDAEATYPAPWLAEAIALAVENNARRWSYVRAILERWAREGRDDGAHRQDARLGRERDSEGPYGAFVRR